MQNEYEDSNYSNVDLYYVDCDKEEQEQRTRELEARRRFVEGMKRFPEMGIPVYIDEKIPDEQDWEKLTVFREDNRFYMADFLVEEVAVSELLQAAGQDLMPPFLIAEARAAYETQNTKRVLKSIHWNLRYHGELRTEHDGKRRRGRKR